MDITIRQITADEVTAFRQNISRAFGDDADEAHNDRWLAQVDLDRTYCAYDGDVMVGTAAAFSFEMTIPGGVAPTGGLTMVSVRPSHRRRGVLRMMMDAHLADVHGRDEAFAALWASEATIYGRFGFGDAVDSVDVGVDAAHTDLRDLDDGTVVTIAARSTHDLSPLHLKGLTLHVVFMLLPLMRGHGRAAQLSRHVGIRGRRSACCRLAFRHVRIAG